MNTAIRILLPSLAVCAALSPVAAWAAEPELDKGQTLVTITSAECDTTGTPAQSQTQAGSAGTSAKLAKTGDDGLALIAGTMAAGAAGAAVLAAGRMARR